MVLRNNREIVRLEGKSRSLYLSIARHNNSRLCGNIASCPLHNPPSLHVSKYIDTHVYIDTYTKTHQALPPTKNLGPTQYAVFDHDLNTYLVNSERSGPGPEGLDVSRRALLWTMKRHDFRESLARLHSPLVPFLSFPRAVSIGIGSVPYEKSRPAQ